jgi:hypothetical protein
MPASAAGDKKSGFSHIAALDAGQLWPVAAARGMTAIR